MKHVLQIKAALERQFMDYLATLSEKEKELISDFIDRMLAVMDTEHRDK